LLSPSTQIEKTFLSLSSFKSNRCRHSRQQSAFIRSLPPSNGSEGSILVDLYDQPLLFRPAKPWIESERLLPHELHTTRAIQTNRLDETELAPVFERSGKKALFFYRLEKILRQLFGHSWYPDGLLINDGFRLEMANDSSRICRS